MSEEKYSGYPSIDKPWTKYYSKEALNADIPVTSIYEEIRERNKDNLQDIAIQYLGKSIKYKTLFRMIDKVADSFVALGVKESDIVTIALPNIPENIYIVYALNKIGAIANLIDLRSKGEGLLHYYNEVNSKVAVVCTMFLKNTLEVLRDTCIEKMIVVSPIASLIPKMVTLPKKNNDNEISWRKFLTYKTENNVEKHANDNDIVCILHTSGTTGTPKGVMLTNRNFNAMALQYKYGGMKCESGDKFLNQVPPFLAYNTIISTHAPLVYHKTNN